MKVVLPHILVEYGLPAELARIINICLNETCSKLHVSNHLCDVFSVQNGLKPGDALSPLLFNFALEYIIGKVQEN
jgi:hypothetical protein